MLPSVTPYNSLNTNRENLVLPKAILVVFIGFGEGIHCTVNAKLELLVRQRLLVLIARHLKVDNHNPTAGKMEVVQLGIILQYPKARKRGEGLADQAAKLVQLQHASLRRSQAYATDVRHKKRRRVVVLEFAEEPWNDGSL